MVRLIAILFIILGLGENLLAQKDRIVEPIDPSRTVELRGNVSSLIKPDLDRGPVDPSQNLTLTLVLRLSAGQQAEMDKLLLEQQDPSSPNYHKWLTPDEYSKRFGLGAQDLDKIVRWLRAEGFEVQPTTPGKNTLAFQGTAAQVAKAFRTEIHHYEVEGAMHFSNTTDPKIPAALEPVVGGILGLNDFRLKPHVRARPKS